MSRFALRLVRGVKNGPSPDWLQKRLTAIGLRPINALVDITNFMTFDRGRPLHVFDAAKVHGNLTVRRAKQSESLLALDGRTYQLDETMCVIADEEGRVARGIMGGEASGCDANTTDVLIEVGAGNPLNIAQRRPQARHQFGRALSLRARRRPELRGAGPRTGDADGADFCGGTRRDRRRGLNACGRPHHRISDRRGEAPVRPDVPLVEMKRVLESRVLRRRQGRGP